ncbi:hypothetical protein HanRHA438_Chr06g0275521 [Helianthus annuus]|uniref:Uncharacterized protein n=1 Tax=Helianthus annuus TaxID=4232 RepID=A0A9K3IU23_HELAN|nr:hypothetical protein HanXRQr2_Chr06g0266451 [Helianthus annuus]KAJ0574089.1 hypothetical protein HanHA89_Chr06g0234221 [Helianthus annuus]KAJ0738424.1 hypothetical protein HanLR1_Chr06g0218151 [Helianthus annuus]KAJ0741312.1 hypothetical protein HanOQP8_Chr06g0226661 [Helianthus annuus]KAJ0912543.1 hypothetical protein HanRHA438_Chr06g0275521 [Helianthus annuus]
MYAAHTKITNLEAKVATLKRKLEEAQADRERVKNTDLAAKDVEIAELKRRLFEAHEKSESLEINLAAEKVKADTAEEACKAAEEVYDHLSLPIMELVTEALKHDDYVARLKSILIVPETVELSDEEEEEAGDGGDE